MKTVSGFRRGVAFLLSFLTSGVLLDGDSFAQEFVRGDVNGDGGVSISDALYLFDYVLVSDYRELPAPPCLDAADATDNGVVGPDDFNALLRLAGDGNGRPCEPFPSLGADPTDDLIGCDRYELQGGLADAEALISIRWEPMDERGVFPMVVTVTSSRPIAGFSLSIAAEGTRVLPLSGAVDDVLNPQAFTNLIAEEKTLIVNGAFVGGVVGDRENDESVMTITAAFNTIDLIVQPDDRLVAGGGVDVSAGRELIRYSACILEGTPVGEYPVEVVRAELVDFETCRPIEPEVTVSPIVVESPLGLFVGCEAPSRPDDRTACDRIIPQNKAEFLRGDANVDGRVSLTDAIQLGHPFFHGVDELPCKEAGDLDLNERRDVWDMIYLVDAIRGVGSLPPAPFPEPGPGSDTDFLPCDTYEVAEAQFDEEEIVLSNVQAELGGMVKVPVRLTSESQTRGIQLVLSFDESVLRPVGLEFEGTLHEDPGTVWFASVDRVGPDVLVAVFVPHIIVGPFWIPPSTDRAVFQLQFEILPGVEPGTTTRLEAVEADDEGGFGPLQLRSELTHLDAWPRQRLASAFPSVVGGEVEVVGVLKTFLRGDSNGDLNLDIADPVHTLTFLFLGGPEPECKDAADSDDDGSILISDAVVALSFLFLGGTALPPPTGAPGVDPTVDELSCGV